MPALPTPCTQVGMTETHPHNVIVHRCFLTSFHFSPTSSIFSSTIVQETQERQRPPAIAKLYINVVDELAPSFTVCVVGNWSTNKTRRFGVFPLYFINDDPVGDTARASSHVGSRCKISLVTCTSPRQNREKAWNKHPNSTAKKEKIKAKITKFLCQRRRFGTHEQMDSVRAFWQMCTKNTTKLWTELCVIFSDFQKSLIVIVTLWKH